MYKHKVVFEEDNGSILFIGSYEECQEWSQDNCNTFSFPLTIIPV